MRRWLIVAAGCLTVAIATPAVWLGTRPSSASGEPVAAAVGPSSATAASATGPAAVPQTGPNGSGPAAKPATIPPVTRKAGPALVRIPGLDLQAGIVPVGVRSDGSMAIPVNVKQVGWYRYGPQPGDAAGASVLAGHVDSKAQGSGALFRLREVGEGDRIDVRLADGSTVGYRVIAKETIVKKRLPTERLFARSGPPRLVLITCGGPFIPELSSYRDNLVVVAEPIGGRG